MKSIIKYTYGMLLMGAVASCSPEEYDTVSQELIPTVSNNTITLQLDEEDPSNNTATFSTQNIAGQTAIWYLDGKVYSHLNPATYSNMQAGDHTLELKIMNRHGLSQGSQTASFTFKETKIDYSPYFEKLVGKEWRVDYVEKGHLGCGEPGTDGSNWWSADPNAKADFGVYDDRITFAHGDSDPVTGGVFTYNPGEGGTVYVNKECKESIFATATSNGTAAEDVMVEVSSQTSTFSIEVDADGNLTIVLAANTLMPYIPNDGTYNNPVYKVEALTNNKLALVTDNGAISWRMVLTSKADTGMPEEDPEPEATMDWNPAAASNLWTIKSESDLVSPVSLWWADAGWGQVASPEYTFEEGVLSLTAVENGGSQWQGQVALHTTLTAEQAKKYNFYCVVESSEDIAGATIKLTQSDESADAKHDDNYFFGDQHAITGGKAFVYKAEGVQLPKGDAHALSLVFDFGGAPAGASIKVSNIYFEEAVSMEATDADNMWTMKSDADLVSPVTFWWADAGWGQVASPEYTYEDGILSLTAVENGGSQWQGQVALHTTLTAEQASAYNFACTVESNEDIAGVTIKLTQSDESADAKHDDNYFFGDRHDVKGGTALVYKAMGVQLPKGDAHALSLVFDFGGAPAGANIKISNIVLKKAE